MVENIPERSQELNDAVGFYRLAMPQPLPHQETANTLPAIISTKALLSYQTHHWFHSKYCFKTSKRTPKECSFQSQRANIKLDEYWISRDSRALGNEYLNPYIPIVNEVIKCNHNLKILSACEGPHVGFYVMKYTTKSQKRYRKSFCSSYRSV
ncbi:hypothetical protein PHMEG_00015482 [Phytophthora megakarya]|uniref:Uncharacterized protein n=1 Tax=Phytophthora megakarya TaxID=4795 RepID=A0A225W399_9STRA|nr:hypothetical protein PHMEG_00015482 [Phytophthora megakarya]